MAYRKRAVTRHGVHSPFVYDLIEEVLRPKGMENKEALRALRQELLSNGEEIEVNDLGAGSRLTDKRVRRVSKIAKTSATPPAKAAMLQRLVDYMGCENVLEMGANLGLTTCTLASAKGRPQVISLEGCPQLAAMAVKNLEKLNLNAEIIVGDFEDTLDLALGKFDKLDMVYMDGNHRREPTLRYFERVSRAVHNDSVVVIGDIHWSGEMEEAWEEIMDRDVARVTIDIFDMGLVFFRKEMTKQNFTIRY